VALESTREIGVAVGVIMTVHHLTQAQAFDLLRAASQHSNCKLVVIAREVADTGTLTMPARTQRSSAAPE
jgi:AmiR/NasT family two-component response regulator